MTERNRSWHKIKKKPTGRKNHPNETNYFDNRDESGKEISGRLISENGKKEDLYIMKQKQ